MSLSSSTSHSNCLSSIAVACAVAILAMSPALPAHAQSSTPSEQPLVHLQHTSWTLKDGMPGPVMAIAQTTDGYLWLGTGAGLFRFDGVRFERFDALAGESLPSRQVLSLFATKDNALWVGLLDGGTALVRAGRILHVDPAKDHFSFSTRGFAAERDGTLWVATGRSLLKRRGNAWTPVGVESGYGNGTPMGTMSIEVDARDNLWVVTDRGMYVKPAGTTRFTAVDVPGLGQAQLALDAAGRAWANDRSDAVRGFLRLPLPGEAAGPYHAVPKSFFMPAFDRAGRLWYGAKDGLNRIEVLDTPAIPPAIAGPAPTAQFLGVDKGLSGELVMRVFQDRDGAIWVGTNGGLDRFRGAAVDRVDLPERTAGIAMAADHDGGLWLAAGDFVHHRAKGDRHFSIWPLSRRLESLTSVFVDSRRRLWIGGRTGLWYQDAGKAGGPLTAVPTPDGQPWSVPSFEITEAADGAIWFNAHRYGLLRFADGQLTRLSGSGAFPRKGPDALTADSRGRIWIGYGDGTLLRHEAGVTATLTPADGVRVGAIKVIVSQGDHVWIGGERGVQRVSDPALPLLRLSDAEALDGVSGIVETPDGELWLNGANGITRLSADEMRRALGDGPADERRPSNPPAGRHIDLSDGLTGRAEQSWPLRTAARTPDGLLWFTLNNGVVRIDPSRLDSAPSPAPPVDVQRLLVHGEAMAPSVGRAAQLPAGTRDVEIAYTAISLAQPERTRFRYRLIGQDRDWQAAGARRRAFYTNLGPGTYDFQVEASQGGGPWSAAPATLRFEIAPTLTQTAWFRAAAVLVGLSTLGVLAALRARRRRLHEQERLAARVQERERIARDLHDTLLQGVYGLILRFEAIARRLPGNERAAMERVLTDADALLIEGRDRVTDLRLPPPDAKRIEHTLEGLGRELSHTHGAAFALSVEGTPRALAPALSESFCLIAREAIFNAFQHAQAERIEVTLRYDDAGFALFVRDDGVGVPDEVQDRGGRQGHWGLAGMRERAGLAGIAYRLASHAGVGTEVELRAPAASVYELPDGGSSRRSGDGWWRRLHRG